VARRTRFEDYGARYDRWCRLEKSPEQILLVQLQTEGADFVLDYRAHGALADLFADIAGDRDLSAVIFTGSGDTFMDRWGAPDPTRDFPAHADPGADALDDTGWIGSQVHLNLLDIQVPVIAAVNGGCSTHSELPLMCDIVLAAEGSWFQDGAHFARGVVPGDGIHTVWPMVFGRNRARYLLLTGERIPAAQAMEYGAVNEVVPRAALLDRAWELARYLALRPPMTLRLTRSILGQELKRAATDDLAAAVYQELYAMRNFLSWRGGQAPLDRAWNDDPWGDERT
jgi:enoyl-CoA hydratase/carnithine racemase